jgi:hypothetical protein
VPEALALPAGLGEVLPVLQFLCDRVHKTGFAHQHLADQDGALLGVLPLSLTYPRSQNVLRLMRNANRETADYTPENHVEGCDPLSGAAELKSESLWQILKANCKKRTDHTDKSLPTL